MSNDSTMIQGLTCTTGPDGGERLRVELTKSGPRALTMGQLALGALMPGVMSKTVAMNVLEFRPHYFKGSQEWRSLTAAMLNARLRSIVDSDDNTFVQSVLGCKRGEVELKLNYSGSMSQHNSLLADYLREMPAVKNVAISGSIVTLKVRRLLRFSAFEEELRQRMRFSL